MARYSQPANRVGVGVTVDTLRVLLDELGVVGDVRMTTDEARDLLHNRRCPDGHQRSRDGESLAVWRELNDRVPLLTMYRWAVTDVGLTRDELLAGAIKPDLAKEQ